MFYLGLAININKGAIAVGKQGAAIPLIEANGNSAAGSGGECINGLESILIENFPDLELILVPAAEASFVDIDRALALFVDVQLGFRHFGPH